MKPTLLSTHTDFAFAAVLGVISLAAVISLAKAQECKKPSAPHIPSSVEIHPPSDFKPNNELVSVRAEEFPETYAEDKAIALKIEGLTRTNNGFYQVTLRIINPTDKALNFTGYSEKSPITKTEHWVEGKWVEEKRFLRCGTGLRPCFINPGQSAVFQVTLEGDKLPARIGLEYRVGPAKTPTEVWSEKVAR